MNTNYRTLHKDIGLIQRTNNRWDLNFKDGDLVKAEDKNSLRTGLILACLTSWNYLNRKGNPTYEIFGNRAYEELKKKKSSIVEYKIKQYFIEVLNRIRRVEYVEDLEVYEKPNFPNDYFIKFTVMATNDEIVEGSFNITTELKETNTYIEFTPYMPYASNTNPFQVDLYLKNEYGVGLTGEIIYAFLKKDNETNFRFIGISKPTNDDGYVRFEYLPKETINYENCEMYFQFKGNSTYNKCISETTSFKSEYININFAFKTDSNYYNGSDGVLSLSTKKQELPLSIKLTEVNVTTNIERPLPNEEILVIGDDGSQYNPTTNFDGEAVFNVTITKNTKFSAYYGREKIQLNINIIKTILHSDISLETSLYVNNSLKIYGEIMNETNTPLQNLKADIFVDNKKIGSTNTNVYGEIDFDTLLEYGTHIITLKAESTNFYEQYTFSETVTVNKYTPLLSISTDENIYSENETLNNRTTYFEDGAILFFAKVENIPSITFDRIKWVLKSTQDDTVVYELGESDVIGNKSQLMYNINIPIGEYYVFAQLIESDTTYESTVKWNDGTDDISLLIIPHSYSLTLQNDVLEEDIVDETVTLECEIDDYLTVSPQTKVRIYSNEANYERVIYSDEEGCIKLQNVPNGYVYNYRIGKTSQVSGQIQIGEKVDMVPLFDESHTLYENMVYSVGDDYITLEDDSTSEEVQVKASYYDKNLWEDNSGFIMRLHLSGTGISGVVIGDVDYVHCELLCDLSNESIKGLYHFDQFHSQGFINSTPHANGIIQIKGVKSDSRKLDYTIDIHILNGNKKEGVVVELPLSTNIGFLLNTWHSSYKSNENNNKVIISDFYMITNIQGENNTLLKYKLL